LKDYFSRGATKEIESVFLISRSNCAFVNYSTEVACEAALQRFHGSLFMGVRIVCRLRDTPSTSSSATQSELTSIERSSQSSPSKLYFDENNTNLDGVDTRQDSSSIDRRNASLSQRATNDKNSSNQRRVSERYFILKSLTLQDLERSVRHGIWATQAQNEAALKNAYEVSQTSKLLFKYLITYA
jgi:hypothetical protein